MTQVTTLPEPSRAFVEAEKLRAEAKQRLASLLRMMMPNETPDVDRIVDCIVGAAVLEVAAMQEAAIRKGA